MNPIHSPDDPRHGTTAGYRAHDRYKAPYCEPCRDARRQADKARRDRTGGTRSGAPTILEKAAREDVDWVVVDRVVNHRRDCPANAAERLQIVREWTAKGYPITELEELVSWNTYRYTVAARLQAEQEAA